MLYTSKEQLLIEFKKLLLDKQMSQREIAQRLNMTPQALTKMMNKQNFSFDDMEQLLSSLDYEMTVQFQSSSTSEQVKGSVSMPLLKEQEYTTDYIYSLPDGQRAELIDGKIYDMSSPGRLHQEIIGELFATIYFHIKTKGGSCKPYMAPFAVFLNQDNRTYVEPDISVICDSSKLTDLGCNGAPDWIIEIVSPTSARMDYMIKQFKYRSAGVREYWIVDPDKKRILVYNFESEDFSEYTFSDCVKVGIFDDLSIDFKSIRI